MVAPILIFAIGNESRGDDALAPMLLRRLVSWLEIKGLTEQCELLEEYQLQVEHVIDLQERKTILFIDAGINTVAPFQFYPLEKNSESVLYSHALSPQALLAINYKLHQVDLENCFVLCIQGQRFELGDSLSAAAATYLDLSFEFICGWLLDQSACIRAPI